MDVRQLPAVGRPARWGARTRSSVAFPTTLYERLKSEAEAADCTFGEYVSMCLANAHDMHLPDPRPNRKRRSWPMSSDAESMQDELPLGA